MSDSKPVQPQRWDLEDVPPCTVAYHFTLLDINQELRYCCHGEKIHAKHSNLNEQWTDKTYSEFRKKWSESYKEKKGLCLGCPHHEENKIWGKEISSYLAEHQERKN